VAKSSLLENKDWYVFKYVLEKRGAQISRNSSYLEDGSSRLL
jgi:hypothetical protein